MEGHLRVPAEPAETIAEAQESIVESFQFLDDWSERYQYLIELGRQLPPFPETAQVEGNRIHGCQSGVWLVCDYQRQARIRGDERLSDRRRDHCGAPSSLFGAATSTSPGHHADIRRRDRSFDASLLAPGERPYAYARTNSCVRDST